MVVQSIQQLHFTNLHRRVKGSQAIRANIYCQQQCKFSILCNSQYLRQCVVPTEIQMIRDTCPYPHLSVPI